MQYVREKIIHTTKPQSMSELYLPEELSKALNGEFAKIIKERSNSVLHYLQRKKI